MKAVCILLTLYAALRCAAAPDLVQYQHYIPQLILRTYGIDAARAYIHFFDTKAMEIKRAETRRVFGVTNLYSQDFLAGDRELEEGLSRLEGAAAPVLRLLREETAEKTTTINKAQGFRLKLFLFTLQFRKQARRQFYLDRSFDPSTLAHISEYMAIHDILTFKESWRRDLATLISMVDGHNINTKRERLYHPVKCEFFAHFMRDLEVWTIPASSERSFLITDSSEGLWEGPQMMPARFVYVVGPKTALVMQTSPRVLNGLGLLDRYRRNTFFPTVPYQPAPSESNTVRQGNLFLDTDFHLLLRRTIDDSAVDAVNFIALNNKFAHGIATLDVAELHRSLRYVLKQTDADPEQRRMAAAALAAIEAQKAAVANKRPNTKDTYYCQHCNADVTATPRTWPVHLEEHEREIGLVGDKKRRKFLRQRARDRFDRFAAAAIEE
jgi:hypothetical protein